MNRREMLQATAAVAAVNAIGPLPTVKPLAAFVESTGCWTNIPPITAEAILAVYNRRLHQLGGVPCKTSD